MGPALRITFVLPTYSPIPVGGYAIVYEYANGLQARGHRVTVVHPWPTGGPTGLRGAATGARSRWHSRRLGARALDWFPIDPTVRLTFVPDLRERFVPAGDAVVATAVFTARPVSDYGPKRGTKLYLLQQHETWWGATPEEVDATWRLPLHKIATGRWLADHAAELGEEANTTYIPNGVDTDRYRLLAPIENRPRRVAMLYHPAEWKGVPDGLQALSAAHSEFPDLEAVLFGTFERPDGLPRWVTYVENPHGDELVRLYNACSVFLHPSWSEGCPLPPAEAMACGCALAAAANPGVCDYARQGHNAMLAPVREPGLLGEALARVLRDDGLRATIALQGHADMQARKWSECIDRFETVIGARSSAAIEP